MLKSNVLIQKISYDNPTIIYDHLGLNPTGQTEKGLITNI
jgi:hypothetical protein